MDTMVIATAVFLTFCCGLSWLIYLRAENGSITDVISVAWIGYFVFVPLAMYLTVKLNPDRGFEDGAARMITVLVVGTLAYMAGLHLTRGRMIAKILPRPAPVLGSAAIWFMWLFSIVVLLICFFVTGEVSGAAAPIQGAAMSASIGVLTLLPIMVVIGYKGHYGTKLLMVGTMIAIVSIVVSFYFSRRPLLGVIAAGGMLFYRVKLMRRPRAVRAMFIAITFTGALLALMFISATRGRRFYGSGAPVAEAFSIEPIMGMMSGVTINYQVLEFTFEEIPRNHGYLWGSGIVNMLLFFVPRAIWPSKPISSGAVITSLWFGTDLSVTNVPNTFFGEMYMNFAVIGAIAGLFLAGAIVRGLNTFLRRESGNLVLWTAWFLISPDFAAEWRGDLTGMTVQAFLRIVFFVGLAWLAARLFRSTTTAIGMGDLDRPPASVAPSARGSPTYWEGPPPNAAQRPTPRSARSGTRPNA